MEVENRFDVALIGCGTWGSNHARALSILPMVRTVHLCDNDGNKAARIADLYAKTKVTRMEEVLSNSTIQAVFVATPAKTHASLVRQLLEAGKHVLVEKPFTMDPTSATELAELSIEKGLRLSVGYIMLHHPAFRRLQESLSELGSLYYLRAVRTNFGFVRGDVGVLWDLAPHDVSMILSISGGLPAWVRATGAAYVQQGFEDLIEIEMQFPTGQLATIHLSWIDPQKERRLTVVGSKKMAIFDDMQALEKLRIYDFTRSQQPASEDFFFRYGSILLPEIPLDEPLRLQDMAFLDGVSRGAREDLKLTLNIERVVAAAEQSLQTGGEKVNLLQPHREAS